MNNGQQVAPCVVCHKPLELRTAKGRTSGKPFLMLICPADGRHFRAFINDQDFVAGVMSRLEGYTRSSDIHDDPEVLDGPLTRSKIDLERAT